jgi:uncharacterized membrane protein
MNLVMHAGPALIDALMVLLAAGVAWSLRPWRVLSGGPPWPWIAMWGAMPWLWALDRYAPVPLALPLSGASMLVLLAGWPLAVLAMLPAAVITLWATPGSAAEALHKLAWLGVMPATLALLLGAALRRWLPHHLFVYILGRGFFGTFIAVVLPASVLALGSGPVGSTTADLLIARVLAAFAEAFLTGMATAILVAFRPRWLATYADRLYLPPPPGG